MVDYVAHDLEAVVLGEEEAHFLLPRVPVLEGEVLIFAKTLGTGDLGVFVLDIRHRVIVTTFAIRFLFRSDRTRPSLGF